MQDLRVAAQVVRVGHKVVAARLRALLEAQNCELVPAARIVAPLAPVLLQQLDGQRVGVDGHHEVEQHAVHGVPCFAPHCARAA